VVEHSSGSCARGSRLKSPTVEGSVQRYSRFAKLNATLVGVIAALRVKAITKLCEPAAGM
jgi:hypothetical protein